MNNNQNSKRDYDKNSRKAYIEQKRKTEFIRRKRRKRQLLDKIKAVIIFSVIGVLICLGVIFTVILIDFSSKDSDSSLPVKITIGSQEPQFLDKSAYFFENGEYYISLTKLSDITDFTLHGNVNNILTLSIDGTDAFSFEVGTPKVLCSDKWSLMSGSSRFENEQFFVPASFFQTFFDDVKNEFNSKGDKEGFNIIFDTTYSPKHTHDTGTSPLSYNEIIERNALKMPQFKSDLSEYEMYMNPQNRDEYLVLINEDNPLSSDYIPDDLHDFIYTRGDRAKQKMRLYAAKALEAMFIEMRANGYTDVSVTSAYRSYEYQSQLFNSRVSALVSAYGEAGARAKVKEGTAVPGSSEHQSGLCADMHNLSAASEAFAAQEVYRWLYANCAEFGFILRYPKNKTDITGIMFEPWHYRYVGRYHARKIMESGVCLEEYMASLGK